MTSPIRGTVHIQLHGRDLEVDGYVDTSEGVPFFVPESHLGELNDDDIQAINDAYWTDQQIKYNLRTKV
jgi:hypothetical protein